MRVSSAALEALPNTTVIVNIDATDDELANKLTGVPALDCLVLNAGGYGTVEPTTTVPEMFASQSLGKVSMATMRNAFEVNTLGPLKLVLALKDRLKEGTKVAIISSMMGSMTDNTSGGSYAYRTAKAAVNMIGKSLAEDLKKDGISVCLIHPGMVASDFVDPAIVSEQMAKNMKPVTPSVQGIVMAIDAMTLENTGAFVHANYGEGLKPCPW